MLCVMEEAGFENEGGKAKAMIRPTHSWGFRRGHNKDIEGKSHPFVRGRKPADNKQRLPLSKYATR